MRTLVLIVTLLASACSDNPPVNYPTVAPFDDTKLALGPGDKIALTIFYGSKETKATYSLDGSGQMEVQFIGSVAAGGKNARSVQEEIQKRLADGYLIDPVVSLTILEINSAQVLRVWPRREERLGQVHARHDDHGGDRAERRVLAARSQEHGAGHARLRWQEADVQGARRADRRGQAT